MSVTTGVALLAVAAFLLASPGICEAAVAAGVSPAYQRGDARDHEHGIDDQRIQSRQGSVPRPPPGDLGTGDNQPALHAPGNRSTISDPLRRGGPGTRTQTPRRLAYPPAAEASHPDAD